MAADYGRMGGIVPVSVGRG